MNNAYFIGERVEILDSDERLEGIVVDIDEHDELYEVDLDNGRLRWYSEDELGMVPTPAQLKKYAQLINRVYEKLSQRKSHD